MSVEQQRRFESASGRGDTVFTEQEVAELAPAEIARRIDAKLRDKSYSPPMLPTIALEVLALSKDPKVDLGQMRKLIETDPLLAGKVLQLAQSSYFARGNPIRSLDDALVRLGIQTLSELFIQLAVTARVFRAKGYEGPMDAIRRHSIACAHLARKVCQKIHFPEEYAFLCGLLHDSGMAAGLIVLADGPRGHRPPKYEAICQAVETIHASASELLATAWQLPDDVRLILRDHHGFTIDGKVHPLLGALCVADALASEAGLSAGNEYRLALVMPAAQAIGISPHQLAELRVQAKQVAEITK